MKHLLSACAIVLSLGTAAPASPGDAIYTHPGQLVSAGDGARLNIYCMGRGSPVVVFDSGFEDWAPAWSAVQPRIVAFTRACSYDRAGAGFSKPGPLPRTSVRIADELHNALRNAGIPGPYILVGSAFGSYNIRAFADRYSADIAGLVLVDGDATDLEPEALQKSDRKGRPGGVSYLRECRDAIAAGRPLPTDPPRPGKARTDCSQQFYRGLPSNDWSPALNAKLLQIARTNTAMYDADISEMEQMQWDENYLASHARPLGAKPIRVLTSGNHGIGRLPVSLAQQTPQHIADERMFNAAQARWLALSSDAKQIFVPNSSEYIQFDQPDFVVNAIHDVYEASKGVPAKRAANHPSGSLFRDCRDCPEMVVIPPGEFIMGSPASEKSWAATHGASAEAVSDEAPQHQVSVPSFAIGRYDVTRDEYAAFVRDSRYPAGDGCGVDSFKWDKRPELTWDRPGFGQGGHDPVVCISWQDANAYIAWLNGKTNRSGEASPKAAYRLPSESEWEYAARAGSTAPFWWGKNDAEAPAHAWFRQNAGGHTHPVGSKPPNGFGLFDMAGNVWQWTEDCYDNSYAGAPNDGRANETPSRDVHANDTRGNCLRVDRGSSYKYPAWLLRSATRERNPADFRDVIMGFRVAKALP